MNKNLLLALAIIIVIIGIIFFINSKTHFLPFNKEYELIIPEDYSSPTVKK